MTYVKYGDCTASLCVEYYFPFITPLRRNAKKYRELYDKLGKDSSAGQSFDLGLWIEARQV